MSSGNNNDNNKLSDDNGTIASKEITSHLSNTQITDDYDEEEEEAIVTIQHLEEKYGVKDSKVMRKIDFRLLPGLVILYLLAFLDRVNISNAVLFGLNSDLNLQGHQYNTALTIFFVPYILAEIPSNMIMKKLTPSKYLPTCMILFGMVVVFQGLVKNFSGLLATRFFLGLFEAGMFPGCFYILAMFYRRQEAQKRYSFFFASTTLAGAFAGLLAGAIGLMDGMHGYKGWRWIFIIEGCATVFFGILAYFFIVDFPEEAKFLTDNERLYLTEKLKIDVGESNRERPITFKLALSVFKDIKMWIAAFMYFGMIVPAYGYAYFAPTIMKQFQYSSIMTQLHSVTPWAAAFGLCNIVAYFSDRIRHRFAFTIMCSLIAIIGFIMLLCGYKSKSISYAGLHLVAAGLYSSMPVIVCWTNTNFSGHLRRAVSTGWQVGFGNIGGIIATFSFVSTQAPRYIPGYSIGIAFTCLSMISCCVYLFQIKRENYLRDKGIGQAEFDALSDFEKAECGDLKPSYRYQY